MSKILITGASGSLGKGVIKHLLKKTNAEDIAVLVRDAKKVEDLKSEGIDVQIGDYNNYESLIAAFKGVDKLLFISGSEFKGRSKQHENVVNAAKETGVKHVVYTSFLRNNETKTSPISFVVKDHIDTERWLKESGMKYTILKHNLYMDMLPLFIGDKVLENEMIYQPAGEGKAAFTLREDMAEVAAHILTTDGHENKEYDITADEAYSYKDIAVIISNITGKTISYVSPSVEEFNKTMTEAGVPMPFIGLFAGFSQGIEQGELEKTSSTIEELLGRKASSPQEYLKKVYTTVNDMYSIEKAIEIDVYHIHPGKNVPLHTHSDLNEVFYCIKGSGFGVFENEEIALKSGETFIAPAGKLHTLRSDEDLFVSAFLVPVAGDKLN